MKNMVKQALFQQLLSGRAGYSTKDEWERETLAKLLSQEEGIPLLKELFLRIDTDNSGTLRLCDFITVWQKI